MEGGRLQNQPTVHGMIREGCTRSFSAVFIVSVLFSRCVCVCVCVNWGQGVRTLDGYSN